MSTLAGNSSAYRAALQMTMVNNSGVALVAGDVVCLDPTLANGVTLTTTLGDDLRLGIVMTGAAIGANVEVMIAGIGPVLCDTSVAAGYRLICSATSHKAAGAAKDGYGASDPTPGSILGMALTAPDADNLAVCVIFPA